MDWGDFLNQTAQDYLYNEVMPEQAPPTVATNPTTGASYQEGQPAGGFSAMLKNPLVLIGGLIAVGAVVYLAVRK